MRVGVIRLRHSSGMNGWQSLISPNHEEQAYLNAVHDIIESGVPKKDRTGVGTLSMVGKQLRFRLYRTASQGGEEDIVIPLLTTKRVFWRGIFTELLWFISGSTNVCELSNQNVHIWDGNVSREFLDSRNLQHYNVGTAGPIYGFQWRHFGAQYRGPDADYSSEGVDQLTTIVEQLRAGRPEDARRIILTAWNPPALKDMALPPCHVMSQFIALDGRLSCVMTQRSADMGLGVPFNIASYALLTAMLANLCNLKTGELVVTFGDAHVYTNHIAPLQEQCARTPSPFPTLRFTKPVSSMDDYTREHFELVDYMYQPPIPMPMAV